MDTNISHLTTTHITINHSENHPVKPHPRRALTRRLPQPESIKAGNNSAQLLVSTNDYRYKIPLDWREPGCGLGP